MKAQQDDCEEIDFASCDSTIVSRGDMEGFKVVLARPSGPGNVGAVARVCANFGCRRLHIVSPCFDFRRQLQDGLSSEMGWYSRHQGLQLLNECTTLDCSVAEAVAECTRVVGFSRRRGRNRDGATQVRAEHPEGTAWPDALPAGHAGPDCCGKDAYCCLVRDLSQHSFSFPTRGLQCSTRKAQEITFSVPCA